MTKQQITILPATPRWSHEILITLAGLAFTLVACIFLMEDIGGIFKERVTRGNPAAITEQGIFIFIALGLVYGAIVYQLCRLGFLLRGRQNEKIQNEDISALYNHDKAPPVTILVPSYKEEIRIIYQTLMSAALQQYAKKNIVLLIDDPANPTNLADMTALEQAKAVPEKINAFLKGPREIFSAARQDFLHRLAATNPGQAVNFAYEATQLAVHYEDAANILETEAKDCPLTDHTDRFFTHKILTEPAQELRHIAHNLRDVTTAHNRQTLLNSYNRLISMFTATLTSFERKSFENLSHEKNKAMNINTYIGLMGKNFRRLMRNDKLFLEPCAPDHASLIIPDTDFIITLDADSLILPEYVARLIYTMQKPGNEKLAVVQTPYSAVPGTQVALERIAGATTDIQLLTHQGFTWCNATFWVGANALLRKAALEEIKTIEKERGYPVTRYIQDRTVIEDTESSIDLVDAGWGLYNYPARMAYSATPPDYGALLIQRRRWANGGLIILPKLLRRIFTTSHPAIVTEAFVRIHYLASIALTSIGVMILILYPFKEAMHTAWLPLSALPYFYLYARDLKLSGYKWSDLFRVYALNLMLIPINLGGVFKSIEQGFTGRKIPFVRTPKIDDRTAAPPLYVTCTFALFIFCLLALIIDIAMNNWLHAAFSGINAAFFAYACAYFIGWKEGLADMNISKASYGSHRTRSLAKIN